MTPSTGPNRIPPRPATGEKPVVMEGKQWIWIHTLDAKGQVLVAEYLCMSCDMVAGPNGYCYGCGSASPAAAF